MIGLRYSPITNYDSRSQMAHLETFQICTESNRIQYCTSMMQFLITYRCVVSVSVYIQILYTRLLFHAPPLFYCLILYHYVVYFNSSFHFLARRSGKHTFYYIFQTFIHFHSHSIHFLPLFHLK